MQDVKQVQTIPRDNFVSLKSTLIPYVIINGIKYINENFKPK